MIKIFSMGDEHGLSLVELLISLILMSIVAAAGYAIVAYSSSYFKTGEKLTDLQQKAHAAMDDMTMSLREGRTIRIPSTASCATGSTNSIDVDIIESGTAATVTYFRNTGGSLLRNNNDGNGNTYLINAADGINVNSATFTDTFSNNIVASVTSIRLRVKLTDNTIAETGHGNIVLSEGAAGECGEDCIELYKSIIPRSRALK